jgi:hypothetical protein
MLLDIAANISASTLSDVTRWGFIDRTGENAIADEAMHFYRIACRRPRTPVASMSGGIGPALVRRSPSVSTGRPNDAPQKPRHRCSSAATVDQKSMKTRTVGAPLQQACPTFAQWFLRAQRHISAFILSDIAALPGSRPRLNLLYEPTQQ